MLSCSFGVSLRAWGMEGLQAWTAIEMIASTHVFQPCVFKISRGSFCIRVLITSA